MSEGATNKARSHNKALARNTGGARSNEKGCAEEAMACLAAHRFTCGDLVRLIDLLQHIPWTGWQSFRNDI